MLASQVVISIASMSIGNTNWEEYVITSRSRYTSVPENHFAPYIDNGMTLRRLCSFTVPL